MMKSTNALLSAFLVISGLLRIVMAATYTVGDTTGWVLGISPTFYDEWAAAQNFVAGDVLVFPYVGDSHNVFEVSKADVASCNDAAPIQTYTTSGGASVTLTAGYHGYICAIAGHCAGNMKMNVQVGAAAAPVASPPTNSSAPTVPTVPTNISAPVPSAINGSTPTIPPTTSSPASVPSTVMPPTVSPTLAPSMANSTTPPAPSPTTTSAPAPSSKSTPASSPPAGAIPTSPSEPYENEFSAAPAPGPEGPGDNAASSLRSRSSIIILGAAISAFTAVVFH